MWDGLIYNITLIKIPVHLFHTFFGTLWNSYIQLEMAIRQRYMNISLCLFTCARIYGSRTLLKRISMNFVLRCASLRYAKVSSFKKIKVANARTKMRQHRISGPFYWMARAHICESIDIICDARALYFLFRENREREKKVFLLRKNIAAHEFFGNIIFAEKYHFINGAKF